jgi:hypothetical protein
MFGLTLDVCSSSIHLWSRTSHHACQLASLLSIEISFDLQRFLDPKQQQKQTKRASPRFQVLVMIEQEVNSAGTQCNVMSMDFIS